MREFFRPNLWPNTPDILTEYLQIGGRPAFMARLVLAATLGASYGIYGPAFELCETAPREPGSEEYLDSEKYEIRALGPRAARQPARPDRAREPHPPREPGAAAPTDGLRFHADRQRPADRLQQDDAPTWTNVIVVVVNLDPHHTQSGWLELPLDELGPRRRRSRSRCTTCSATRATSGTGARNYVELDPARRCRRTSSGSGDAVRTERDFDYYL